MPDANTYEDVYEYPDTYAEAKKTARAFRAGYHAMNESEGTQVDHRITKEIMAIYVIIAIFIDLIQALLVETIFGGSIISIAADTLFVMLFWLRGVSIVGNPRRFFAMSAQALIALIPILNVLPELTIGILATCLITRAEDSGTPIGQVAGIVSRKMAK